MIIHCQDGYADSPRAAADHDVRQRQRQIPVVDAAGGESGTPVTVPDFPFIMNVLWSRQKPNW